MVIPTDVIEPNNSDQLPKSKHETVQTMQNKLL